MARPPLPRLPSIPDPEALQGAAPASWRRQLEQLGCTPADHHGVAIQQGQALAPEHSGQLLLVDLSGFAPLHLRGPGALEFLQGYSTADLQQLGTAGRVLAGAQCSRDGRMVANHLALGHADEVIWRVHGSVAAATAAALKPYLTFAQAQLLACPDAALVRFGLLGAAAVATLTGLGLPVPAAAAGVQPAWQTTDSPGIDASAGQPVRLLRHPGATTRLELWTNAAGASALLEQLRPVLRPGAMAAWDQLDASTGVAWLTATTSATYLPHMFNLQATGAVSFSKGCYLGQEIVARMEHRGQSKKILCALDGMPGPMPLGSAVSHAGSRIGELVWCGSTSALAVCQRSQVEGLMTDGHIHLADYPELELQLRLLSYTDGIT